MDQAQFDKRLVQLTKKLKKRRKSMPEDNGMPSPFPLEAAVNSTADLKNAELASEEVTPNTQKTISKTKSADEEFEILAKKKGWIKKPVALTMDQKVIRGALVSFAIMAILLWIDWVYVNTQGNLFLGTWEGLLATLKTTGILFTQVVLAKVKQFYSEKKELVDL